MANDKKKLKLNGVRSEPRPEESLSQAAQREQDRAAREKLRHLMRDNNVSEWEYIKQVGDAKFGEGATDDDPLRTLKWMWRMQYYSIIFLICYIWNS